MKDQRYKTSDILFSFLLHSLLSKPNPNSTQLNSLQLSLRLWKGLDRAKEENEETDSGNPLKRSSDPTIISFSKKPKIENGENVLEQSNEPNILAQNDFSLQDDLIQYDSKEAVAKTVHENSFSGDTTLDFEMFEQIYETEDQKEKLQDKEEQKKD